MNQTVDWERQATEALKRIARRQDLKAHVERTPALNGLLSRAAARYVAGASRKDGIEAGRRLLAQEYAISLEYIGENTTDAEACMAAAEEMAALIAELGELGAAARASFDLSHIGLAVDDELAFAQLLRLSRQARETGIEPFVSMEESAKTDRILAVYKRAAAEEPGIGITLQAYLNRTPGDLAGLAGIGGPVRLVKGAYEEPREAAIGRSAALNERYLSLVESALAQGRRVSVATHDEALIEAIVSRGWARHRLEFELLYGIRPDLAGKLKASGYPVRVYAIYGEEWYLYLCHRLAEFPPNLYRAIADIAGGAAADPMSEYA
ncbi:proline dehydrogenase family protein [Paenibacillus methanolicus]|uniref:proline dehydrogenase n=1 Tax=Paenibacillus methanolicus TaxID=582686 RepID=A0A5S5CFP7_9BACL|nr:proline dehydrogenase family protein [Paenibacillus methanolicus]TYP78155.1 proline dehydrogenase [Paenibacillus methanolicus]